MDRACDDSADFRGNVVRVMTQSTFPFSLMSVCPDDIRLWSPVMRKTWTVEREKCSSVDVVEIRQVLVHRSVFTFAGAEAPGFVAWKRNAAIQALRDRGWTVRLVRRGVVVREQPDERPTGVWWWRRR